MERKDNDVVVALEEIVEVRLYATFNPESTVVKIWSEHQGMEQREIDVDLATGQITEYSRGLLMPDYVTGVLDSTVANLRKIFANEAVGNGGEL